MSDPDNIAAQIAAATQQRAQAAQTHNAPPPKMELTRAAAQGLTLGAGDEIEAWARSTFGDEDYGEALQEARGAMAEYRKNYPGQATFVEVGGAMLPAFVSMFFSGGGTAPAWAARFPKLYNATKTALLGGMEGAGYAFNTGEGGFEHRVSRTPAGAATGILGATVGYGAIKAGQATFGKLLDHTRRTMGPRASGAVEREFRKAVEDSGFTLDEVIERIARGDVPVELQRIAGNKTMATIARGYYAQSRKAGSVLENALSERPDALRNQMMEYLQDNMAPGNQGNILKYAKMDDEALRKAAGQDYDQVFSGVPNVGDDVTAELSDAYRRVPAAKADLDKLYRAQTGETPFFKVEGDNLIFTRNPTLEEAEVMRRAINSAASREFAKGGGAVGNAYGDVESRVRGALDDQFPELGEVRQKWSAIESGADAFKEGRKALSRSPEDVELIFEEMAAKPNGETLIKNYRAGAAAAFKAKGTTGSKASLAGMLADPSRKEGLILRNIFPQDQLDEMLTVADRASRSQVAKNTVLNGSPTAATQGRMAEQGVAVLGEAVEAVSGSPMAALNLAKRTLKSMTGNLSEKQLVSLAKLMVETNPDVLRRALTDTTALDAVYRLGGEVMNRVSRAGGMAGGQASYPAVRGLLSQP